MVTVGDAALTAVPMLPASDEATSPVLVEEHRVEGPMVGGYSQDPRQDQPRGQKGTAAWRLGPNVQGISA